MVKLEKSMVTFQRILPRTKRTNANPRFYIFTLFPSNIGFISELSLVKEKDIRQKVRGVLPGSW